MGASLARAATFAPSSQTRSRTPSATFSATTSVSPSSSRSSRRPTRTPSTSARSLTSDSSPRTPPASRSRSPSPQSGPVGTTFDMTYTFTVINQTGAGEIAFGVNPPSGFPFGGGQLETGIAPGTYDVKLQVQAQPNEMEPFSPGKYPTEVAVCNGICGATHPYTATLCEDQVTFTITQ